MLLGPDPEESGDSDSQQRLQSPHLPSDAASSASRQTSPESITGELALVPPILGASQRLLNRDHYQAYYQVPGVVIRPCIAEFFGLALGLEVVKAVHVAATQGLSLRVSSQR